VKLIAVFCLLANSGGGQRSPECRGSCVEIGENVSAFSRELGDTLRMAAHFGSDGTVTVYLGAMVPGVRDAEGRPVRIRRVKVVKPPGQQAPSEEKP
jgi:hypothetical protein